MIDWSAIKRKWKKNQALAHLEAEMEILKMEKIVKSEKFTIVGEQEAAKILSVSYSKLKQLRKDGQIEFLRIGKSVKYTIRQLERFVERGVIQAQG
jgi:excisionase family DNA binding protein